MNYQHREQLNTAADFEQQAYSKQQAPRRKNTGDCNGIEHRRADSFLSSSYRSLVYDKDDPEFSPIQLLVWVLIIGVVSGIFTHYWKTFCIEPGMEFVWNTVPTYLVQVGVFTPDTVQLYVVVCPTVFSTILGYGFTVYHVSSQDDLLASLHQTGLVLIDIFPTIILCTATLWSGLSLGPELPLIILGGQLGSLVAKTFHQSTLQARVLTLVGASSMVAGFFGFALGGAMFILELPHVEGLEYFEAFGHSMLGSVVSVVVNRVLINLCDEESLSEDTVSFVYPDLPVSADQHVPNMAYFWVIVFGVCGGAPIGLAYLFGVGKAKRGVDLVFDWLQAAFSSSAGRNKNSRRQTTPIHLSDVEETPVIRKENDSLSLFEDEDECFSECAEADDTSDESSSHCHQPTAPSPLKCLNAAIRAGVGGLFAGILALYVPSTAFWGESQMQSLVDLGRTTLPFVNNISHPNASVENLGGVHREMLTTTHGLMTIAVAKVLHIGLSLGTHLVGGHFWGPLFVAVPIGHSILRVLDRIWILAGYVSGFPKVYRTLLMLCCMGGAHVIIFRAYTAIALILFMTVSKPAQHLLSLLFISIFVASEIGKGFRFYKEQKPRSDVVLSPLALQPSRSTDYDRGYGSLPESFLVDYTDLELRQERHQEFHRYSSVQHVQKLKLSPSFLVPPESRTKSMRKGTARLPIRQQPTLLDQARLRPFQSDYSSMSHGFVPWAVERAVP